MSKNFSGDKRVYFEKIFFGWRHFRRLRAEKTELRAK